MICMIPKVNLGVGEMGFMFCDLYLNMCFECSKEPSHLDTSFEHQYHNVFSEK